MYRSARPGADPFTIHNTEGDPDGVCCQLRIWTVLLSWVPTPYTGALTAESQEHHWQDGVEEIQQALEASYCAQRDQVKTDPLSATYTWYRASTQIHMSLARTSASLLRFSTRPSWVIRSR